MQCMKYDAMQFGLHFVRLLKFVSDSNEIIKSYLCREEGELPLDGQSHVSLLSVN